MHLNDRIWRSKTLPMVVEIRQEKVAQILSESIPEISPRRFMESRGRQKILRIMIAAPGSGKNTYIDKHYQGAAVVSADDHPGLYGPPDRPGGEPSFHTKHHVEAHTNAQKKADGHMAAGHPHVIVNNTNTTAWQAAPYLKLAAKHGYNVKMTHLSAPLEDIRARGTHISREKPPKGEPDKLAIMKNEADGFAKQLHSLKDHPAPMKVLDKEGAFHAPWEDEPEKRQDHSNLHKLKHDIETIDTSTRR